MFVVVRGLGVGFLFGLGGFVLTIWFAGADYLVLAVCCGGLSAVLDFVLWVFV